MRKVLLFCLLLGATEPPLASDWTLAEVMQLPPPCRGMQSYLSEEARRAVKGHFPLPPGWDATANHLCGGIVQVMRGERALSPKEKTEQFRSAVENLDGYTSLRQYESNPAAYNQAQRNYYALIYYFKARAYKGLNKIGDMLTHYQNALKANPRLEPAYRDLYDFYKKSGDTATANMILERGLRAIPNSKALLKRKEGS